MKTTTTESKQQAADAANRFTTALALLNKGAFPSEAGEALAEVIQAVRETGKKGALVIRLNIDPVPKTEGAQVSVTPDLTTKTPKLGAKARTFYTDAEGQLHREDPNQGELSFTVRAPKGKAAAANDAPAAAQA